jgi:hypothetical protein
MDDRETGLKERARRAYERGRLAGAARRSVLLLPVLGAASLCCPSPGAIVAGGAGLFAVVTFCLWRGQEFRLGVRPGLVAGFVPLLLPILVQAIGHACAPGRCLLFPAVCGLGGLAGGVALGILAPHPREGRGIPFVTACLIAALAGSVGCVLYGLFGLGVMGLGLLLGAGPILAARRA